MPTTPAPTTAPRPVFIGDRVSRDSWDGAGIEGVTVRLLIDADRNGVGERVVQQTTTAGNGRYGFDVEPGCYVVSFTLPAGLAVVEGQDTRALCLDPGGSDARVDLVLGRAYALRTPQSCEVQIGTGDTAGVEIQDSNGDFAPSYVFYGRNREVVRRTSQLGPPDDVERTSIKWTSAGYGYEESDVWFVAAESGGQVSGLALCQRRFV